MPFLPQNHRRFYTICNRGKPRLVPVLMVRFIHHITATQRHQRNTQGLCITPPLFACVQNQGAESDYRIRLRNTWLSWVTPPLCLGAESIKAQNQSTESEYRIRAWNQPASEHSPCLFGHPTPSIIIQSPPLSLTIPACFLHQRSQIRPDCSPKSMVFVQKHRWGPSPL